MKRTYVEWNPHGKTRRLIELAEAICVDYADQGYDLTLRQLYYQLVAERAQLTRASEIWGTVVANCLQEDED